MAGIVLAMVGPAVGQLSPKEGLASLHVAPGFRVELAASEPAIVDPIAMCFDADGVMYVCEMRGFQLGPGGVGADGLGTIRRLEDRDNDGHFETHTLFARDMTFPTTIMAYAGGVLVGAAPDLLYFKDTNGDGVADVREVLYTGFGQGNHEQLLNTLQFAHDNWIYACAGGNGGDIRSTRRPGDAPVSMRGRSFRFKPFGGPFEATTGGGQYGLSPDDWGRWFICSNANHIRQRVLPDRYLRRNPDLAVRRTLLDISDHGAAAKLHRRSPLEEWRVIRTRQRAADPAYRKRLTPTELVAGGYITAACAVMLYRGGLFGPEFVNNTFVCDASNNLVHRDVLVDDGITYIARRAESDGEHEFLASTDNWHRPCFLTVGPHGALYVVDMYRQIIETPASIPAEIQQKIDMEAGNAAGRIYRIVPEGFQRLERPALRQASTAKLVGHLGHANAWVRLTAQRLLVERRDRAAINPLRRLADGAPTPQARLHALWTLEAFDALDEARIISALRDREPGLRENAIRLAEGFLYTTPAAALVAALLDRAGDESPRVRFQLAFTLGELDDPRAIDALARIASRDAEREWTRAAVLSSCASTAHTLLDRLLNRPSFRATASDGKAELVRQLGAVVAARQPGDPLETLIARASREPAADDAWWRTACLRGISDGLRRAGRGRTVGIGTAQESLVSLLQTASPELRRAAGAVARRVKLKRTEALAAAIQSAVTTALDPTRTLAARRAAIEQLGLGGIETVRDTMPDLLSAQQPTEIQTAAVAAIEGLNSREAGALLVAHWRNFSPAVRTRAMAALFSRRTGLSLLLDGIEAGTIQPWSIEPARRSQLLNYPDDTLRRRAATLLKEPSQAVRLAVLKGYQPALELQGDVPRGAKVFAERCGDCHKLAGIGFVVGPDLTGVRDRPAEQLLRDIIIPSHALVPGYEPYIVQTTDGAIATGILASESASSITLRQAKGVELTVLRRNIAQMASTSLSIMPTELEAKLSHQNVADLIAFLKQHD